MTRRDRMERRQARREEWEEKAKGRASARFGAASGVADQIPLGQPILIGHHSERRARRDQDRIRGNMDKGCEELRLARRHASKAAGIASALERTIFSDDEDAVEQLRERIAKAEAEATRYKAINRAWRKSKGNLAALIADGTVTPRLAETIKTTMDQCSWLKAPFSTTNIRARIRTDQKRLEGLLQTEEVIA